MPAVDTDRVLIIGSRSALAARPADSRLKDASLVELTAPAAKAIALLGRGIFYDHDLIFALVQEASDLLALNRGISWAGRPWLVGQPLGHNHRILHLSGKGPCFSCLQHHDEWRELPDAPCTGWPLASPPRDSALPDDQWHRIWAALQDAWLHDTPGTEIIYHARRDITFRRSFDMHPACDDHLPIPRLRHFQANGSQTTIGELVAEVRQELGPDAVLESHRHHVRLLVCGQCAHSQHCFRPLSTLDPICARCGSMQTPRYLLPFGLEADILSRTVVELGIPADDVLIARCGMKLVPWRLHD